MFRVYNYLFPSSQESKLQDSSNNDKNLSIPSLQSNSSTTITTTLESNQKPVSPQQESIPNENKIPSFSEWLDAYLKSKNVESVELLVFKWPHRQKQIIDIVDALNFPLNQKEKLTEKIIDKEKNLTNQEKGCLIYLSTEEKEEILKDIVLTEILTDALSRVKKEIEEEYKYKDPASSDLYIQVKDMLGAIKIKTLFAYKDYPQINEARQKWSLVHLELPDYLHKKNEEKKQVQKVQQTWSHVRRQLVSAFNDQNEYQSSRKSLLTREGEPFDKQVLNQFDRVMEEAKNLKNLRHVETKEKKTLLQRGEDFVDPIPYFNEEEVGRFKYYQNLEKKGVFKDLHERIEKFDHSKLRKVQTINTSLNDFIENMEREEQKSLEEKENLTKEQSQSSDRINSQVNSSGAPIRLFASPDSLEKKHSKSPSRSMSRKQKKQLKKRLKEQDEESRSVLSNNEDKGVQPKVN